jgi:hypothetical protein
MGSSENGLAVGLGDSMGWLWPLCVLLSIRFEVFHLANDPDGKPEGGETYVQPSPREVFSIGGSADRPPRGQIVMGRRFARDLLPDATTPSQTLHYELLPIRQLMGNAH